MNGSTRLGVRAVPGATKPGLVGRHGTAWKVTVSAPAEAGRANEAVIRLLADTVELPRRDVSIVAGHGSREKVVSFDGISAKELDARLAVSSIGGETSA
ncbi:MAG TPA: DUF167 domain-containing protein [Gaiellaceae bacterium]|nr:DUF167 domain-containing protein [Gaiellaceae bacterium]